jgi:hypothetical protein
VLSGELLAAAGLEPESGLQEASNKPAPAAAVVLMNSRRVKGCFTIF